MILTAALFLAAVMQAAPEKPAPARIFTDVTDAAGITFVQKSSPEKRYIVESMSGGVALIDYDNDGWSDIYFVNSCTTENYADPKCARSALYRNEKGMKFKDVTDQAGVGYPGWGVGVCVADYDGDGFDDLYVTTIGKNRLYRNKGNGTFDDMTDKAGVAGGNWSAGCGFADYDNDGDLDLFVSRYVNINLKELPEFGKGRTCQFRGVAVQCGPRGLPGMGDLLYRNNGDGTFVEVGKEAGVDDAEGFFGLGIAWFDYNNDGLIDLFVANDSNPNLFYQNLGKGKFKEIGFPTGLALSEDGSEQGCMGVALGDYNGDGRPDIFVTNFAEEYNTLYRQDADTNFTDVSFAANVAAVSLPYVGWGTTFFDYDNDGWQDLFAGNGHVYPQLENAAIGGSAPYRQRKLLHRNRGNGTFEEVAAAAGPALLERRVSRGSVVGDLDNDGDLDLVSNDLDSKPMLLRNDSPPGRHWLQVKLKGKGKNLNAIGARVRLTAGGRAQTQWLRSGTSYISQDDFRLHFGLGQADKVDAIEVTWPGGATTKHGAAQIDRSVVIEQP